MRWKAKLMTAVAFALIVAGRFRWSRYLVEEALTVLLSVAVLLLPMLLTVIAFLLLWQGASFVFRRLAARIERIISLRDRRLRAGHATRHRLAED